MGFSVHDYVSLSLMYTIRFSLHLWHQSRFFHGSNLIYNKFCRLNLSVQPAVSDRCLFFITILVIQRKMIVPILYTSISSPSVATSIGVPISSSVRWSVKIVSRKRFV